MVCFSGTRTSTTAIAPPLRPVAVSSALLSYLWVFLIFTIFIFIIIIISKSISHCREHHNHWWPRSTRVLVRTPRKLTFGLRGTTQSLWNQVSLWIFSSSLSYADVVSVCCLSVCHVSSSSNSTYYQSFQLFSSNLFQFFAKFFLKKF